jgi:SnoaL-like domain
MPKAKNQLQDLLDREAIRDLPLRYCDCVWRNDIPGLLKLFTKDGEFVIDAAGKEMGAKGQAALLQIYRQGLEIEPRPYIHNHVLELTSDKKAHGRCYLALHSGKRNMEFIGAGHYADTYVKVKGEWKFQRRYFTAVRLDENGVSAPKPAKVAARPRKRAK